MTCRGVVLASLVRPEDLQASPTYERCARLRDDLVLFREKQATVKRYVADTHVVLWWLAGEEKKLGKPAKRVLSGVTIGASGLLLSIVSLWEIAMLNDDGKIVLPAGFGAWCDALESLSGLVVEPLTPGDINEARTLRSLVDPHDRLIAGVALHHGLPLLTADRRMQKEKRLRTVWE